FHKRTFDFKRDLTHHNVAMPQAGGWAQSKWQAGVENIWEFNSREVAERLGKIVQEHDLDFVLVSGDVSAVRYLKEHASELLREEIIDTGINAHSFDEVGPDLERALSGVVAGRVKATLERYLDERGQHDLATEGWEDTFEALRMSQVATLLIGDQAQHRHGYFILDDPNQISLDRAELEGIGAGDVLEADALTIAVRSAVGTNADVRVVPDLGSQHGPKHGIGALLRFKT
ncbi:MAG TPA: Vms1/Ankzf1 family peptidyl-tRNA hydrolase, partial [Actinomycetota bacterium]|nr:Vms1/Ankzf1 family peptidyl-tRNA hydrolase [Actinomycetota bacterium]